ncbi:hypothetical protein AB7M56_005754 [Bradyrhizobium elkanii]|nr:hypothetical protein [Bradyrhizobium elkanii]MCS3518922.1 hypothetical protein [Bradyrhizobium elkanii]MCS4075480.1 hypothetical protein [Bradyrhizobium elkanii]MCS4082113.1 hypothetical protein [Bradyrhizobium elkanii]MCS4106721.1 hypothetical protein [Bradyrhizobium elkanii]
MKKWHAQAIGPWSNIELSYRTLAAAAAARMTAKTILVSYPLSVL